MDFQKLMTVAIQNKARDEKQHEMKKVASESKGGRLNNQRISQAALHAHLAKRKELKQKAAKKDSARLVRVQGRLPQSPSRNEPPESKTVARGIQHRGKDETNPGRSSHQQLPISSAANNGIKEKRSEKDHWSQRKGVELAPSKRQIESKGNSLVKISDTRKAAVDNPKCLQGGAKKCGPMTFKDLIAVAAKNKDGTSETNERKFNTQNEISKSSIHKERNSLRLKTEERKSENKTNNFHRTDEDRTTTRGNGGWSIEKGKRSEVVSKKSLNQSKPVPPKLSSLEVRCRSTGKIGKSVNSHVINQRRPVSSSERYPDQQRGKELKKRKRDPLVDGMEDFIDDGDVDDVDVSKYIKEIFGYDKSRYYDGDEDLSNMESNYAQIEREEVKSSRIARLEDEIEHLKELAELKKEKQKLKKRLKS